MGNVLRGAGGGKGMVSYLELYGYNHPGSNNIYFIVALQN